MKLLSKSDLATRWGVTRQVVNNWSNRHDNFPKEFCRVDNNHMPLYLERDVEEYEKEKGLNNG